MAIRGTWWGRTAIGLVVVAIAIQFIPYGVDNPSTRDEPAWDSPRTRELFMRACADCHSNETKVLWFEHVAPVKWYIANHVEEGRGALNVSEWSTDPGREVEETVEVIEEGEMPLDSYTYFGLHDEANLSDAERQELIDGLEATLADDPPILQGDRRDGDGER